MFEGSLLESTTLLQTRNRWPVLASVAAQVAACALLIAVPLLHPELLPLRTPSLVLHAPPPPPPPLPAPPPPRVRIAADTRPTATLTAPAPLPANSLLHTTPANVASTADTPLASFIGDGLASGSTATLGLTMGSGAGPNVAVAPARPAAPSHVLLSSGVTTGLLLAPIQPDYPAIAKATRQEGTVIVRAIISRSGSVQSAHIVSGPAMLQAAALAAVARARYRPYLLNGEPTEVETTVTINFRLGG